MSKPPPPAPAGPASEKDKGTTHTSGRVQFDERGQAVWAWAVATGMFDRHATTQRVRTLSESTVKLELAESPGKGAALPRKGAAFTPYDSAPAARPASAHDGRGGDPYSSAAAKRPEAMNFNPYERTSTKPR